MSYEPKGAPVMVETATPGPGGTIEARNIGPHGPTGPMHVVDPDYMRAIGPHGAEGPLEPMPTEWARAIGPHGAQGPLIPLEGLGTIGDFISRYRTAMLVLGAGVLGWMFWKKQKEGKAPILTRTTAEGDVVQVRPYKAVREKIIVPPDVVKRPTGDADWMLFESDVKDRISDFSLGVVGPSYKTEGKWTADVNVGWGDFLNLGTFDTSNDAVIAVLMEAEDVPVSHRRPMRNPTHVVGEPVANVLGAVGIVIESKPGYVRVRDASGNTYTWPTDTLETDSRRVEYMVKLARQRGEV